MSELVGNFKVGPTLEDYESATFEGVWYPRCPHCGTPTPAEPDADRVVCQTCERQISLVRIV